MKKYGYYNGIFWEIIDTPYSTRWQCQTNTGRDALEKGECVFISDDGGYHIGTIYGVIDIHMADSHPKLEERFEKLVIELSEQKRKKFIKIY